MLEQDELRERQLLRLLQLHHQRTQELVYQQLRTHEQALRNALIMHTQTLASSRSASHEHDYEALETDALAAGMEEDKTGEPSPEPVTAASSSAAASSARAKSDDHAAPVSKAGPQGNLWSHPDDLPPVADGGGGVAGVRGSSSAKAHCAHACRVS